MKEKQLKVIKILCEILMFIVFVASIILALYHFFSINAFAAGPGGSGDTSGGFGSDDIPTDIPTDVPVDSDYELPYPVLPPEIESKTFMFNQDIAYFYGEVELNITGQVALNTEPRDRVYHTINFDIIKVYQSFQWANNNGPVIFFGTYEDGVYKGYPVFEDMSCVFTVYGGTDLESEVFQTLLDESFIDISHIIQSNEYYYQVGANDGYYIGYSQASTKQFGTNMLLSIITAPYNVLDSFTLFEANGVPVSMWNVLVACIGIAMFIWFIKMFAGG